MLLSSDSHGVFPIWDAATRFFHWNLIFLIGFLWWSAETERFDLHEFSGIYLLSLLIWRIFLGFFGSESSKFNNFLVSPKTIRSYLRGVHTHNAGHNPLGGWMIVIMLFVLMIQGISGLFNTDDIFFYGPLYYMSSDNLRGIMGEVHNVTFCWILLLVSTHVVAVLWHQIFKQTFLIQAMIKGKAVGQISSAKPVGQMRLFVILFLIYIIFLCTVSLVPQAPSIF